MLRCSSRRRFLLAALVGTATGVAGCSGTTGPDGDDAPDGTDGSDGDGADDGGSSGSPSQDLPDAVALEPVATGLQAALDVEFAPEADRRYVVERPGRIRVHDEEIRDEPFLDLTDRVATGGERGLLGLALHPEFPGDPRVFVRYSAPPRERTPDGFSHTFVVAEFELGDDGTRADPGSERTILEIPQPQANHNAGDLAFGPEGYLYVATGDGGAAADQGRGHVDDWYDAVDGGNGQNTTENLLGGILRIDVDERRDREGGPVGGSRAYGIPDDNPLVGDDHYGEYYAWGFRNPWRLSFDGEELFVGDVGQSDWEEVNLVERGGNYGWNVREATHCFRATDCPDETPGDVRGGEPFRDPILEYPNRAPSPDAVDGKSVIGGCVSRGSAIPALEGRYVFGDLLANGRLFVATRPDDGDQWSTDVLRIDDGGLDRILSFGRDGDGDVYVVDGGAIRRVVTAG